jgi:nickel-dependent lactate racemase
VREDIEEAAEKSAGIDFIVNVVLDAHKEIIRAVAGDVTEGAPRGLQISGHACTALRFRTARIS